MKALPIFLKLKGRSVLLLGGGAVAEAKARLLLAAGARLTVLSRQPSDAFLAWAADGDLDLQQRTFQPSDLAGRVLAIAADAPAEQSQQLYQAASQSGLPVNVVDQPELSSFIMPAIIDRSPVVVAISTFGNAPVLARRIRAAVELLLPERLGRLADFAQRYRGAVKAQVGSFDGRRKFWEQFFDGPIAAKVLEGREQAAHGAMLAELNQEDLLARASQPEGRVVTIAVPEGDPELLTLRDFRLLQSADLVLHDPLAREDLLQLARREARLLPVAAAQGLSLNAAGSRADAVAAALAAGKTIVRLVTPAQAPQSTTTDLQVMPGGAVATGAPAAGAVLRQRC
tara:strand:+ start:5034 stop:6059 length:1026 start_codon:yes stop_codon:yes gene_type:complete